MTYRTEKRTTDGTTVTYTGKLGYPRIIGHITKRAAKCYVAEGGPFDLGAYCSLAGAKHAVIASFERLGGRTGNPADAIAAYERATA